MKIRKVTVCHTCRRKKKRCDGKLPACSQCIGKGVRCEGYRHDFIFRSPATVAPQIRTEKQREEEAACVGTPASHHGAQVIWYRAPGYSKGQSPATPPPQLSWTLADIVSLVVQNFAPVSVYDGSHKSLSRVCGGWIEALPALIGGADDGQVLAACVTALATSIVFKGPDGRAPLPDVLEAQGSALRALRTAFGRTNTQPWNQFIASIMCLCLSELMLPTSDATWGAHANGISRLIRQRPPDFYAAGIPHKLFAGFRPILVKYAFHSRTPTFLAEEQWRTLPFSVVKPTALQTILTEAAIIPSLLESVDILKCQALKGLSSDTAGVRALNLIGLFVDSINRLFRWQEEFEISCQTQLYWETVGPDGDVRLHFSSITNANCLTWLWACSITCIVNIKRLLEEFEGASGNGLEVKGQPLEWVLEPGKALQLSLDILRSIEFLMQDEFRMAGPSSTFLPLKVAHDFITTDKNSPLEAKRKLRKVIAMSIAKGYHFNARKTTW